MLDASTNMDYEQTINKTHYQTFLAETVLTGDTAT